VLFHHAAADCFAAQTAGARTRPGKGHRRQPALPGSYPYVTGVLPGTGPEEVLSTVAFTRTGPRASSLCSKAVCRGVMEKHSKGVLRGECPPVVPPCVDPLAAVLQAGVFR